MKRTLSVSASVLVLVLVLLQFIPLAGAKTNPPVVGEPAWDSPATRELAVRACYDCHSNETKWPWYADVAPVSYLVRHHVHDGREKLNFSEWGVAGTNEEAGEAAETVEKGEMPESSYVFIHPEARLSSAEKEQLIRGLEATLGRDRGGEEQHGGEDD